MNSGSFPHYMLKEIYDQADTVQHNIDENEAAIKELAKVIVNMDPSRIYAIGCGDSRFTAMIAKHSFGSLIGIPIFEEQSFEMLNYILNTLDDTCLVMAYSNSGETQKTVQAAEALRLKGVPVIGFTSKPESRLANITPYTIINKLIEKPMAAPHTTSYIANLTTTLSLCIETAHTLGIDVKKIKGLFHKLPELIRETITLSNEVAREIAHKHKNAEKHFFIGAGPHYSTAQGGYAKLIEAAYSNAIQQELEEFAHLQMFIVEPGDPVIIVTSKGPSEERAIEMAVGANDLGADVIVVSEISDGPLSSFYRLPVAKGAEDFEPFTSLTHLIPLELYAYYVAISNGLNPDKIRYFDVNMRLIGQGKKKQAIEE